MNVNYIIRCSTLIRYFLNSLPPPHPFANEIFNQMYQSKLCKFLCVSLHS